MSRQIPRAPLRHRRRDRAARPRVSSAKIMVGSHGLIARVTMGGVMTQENQAGADAQGANANSESFLPHSTVLIVDDNPQNVELLQAFLESLPVKIVTASDGVDALEKVNQHNPDLILLDIMMPRMSGFQVCRKLKGEPKTRDIQILMVTALNE